jgi:hypothetical protein
MTGHILGLDLGLAHAGAARLRHATTPDTVRITTWHHQTPALPDDAPIGQVAARIRDMARWAIGRTTTDTVLVVIEGPSHASVHGQPHERAGVWWLVVDQLVRHHVPVAVLPPTTVKGYIAGKGTADKATVQAAVHAAWPGQGLDRVTNHETDAVALATAGADWLQWSGPYLEGRRGAGWLRKAHCPDPATV